jgi:hypothetical protein
MFLRQIALLSLAAAACFAQQYEVGGSAGAGFARNATITNATGSAAAGLKSGAAFGGWIGHRMYPRMSGEIRYSFTRQDLMLSSGGSGPEFTAQGHALHYDLLFHPRESRSKVQPFVAVGGGFKFYRGTGKETAYQPLGSFGYLTKTQEWQPMISAGGGVKMEIAPRILLRAEFRDYITPFPKKLIAPAANAKVGGWVHDIVPLIGISLLF